MGNYSSRTIMTPIRMPRELRAALEHEAGREGVTLTGLIVSLLRGAVASPATPEPPRRDRHRARPWAAIRLVASACDLRLDLRQLAQ